MSEFDPPRRSSSAIAVVLAVVFLAVIGSAVGFILGTRGGGSTNTASGPTTTGSSPSAEVSVDPTTPTGEPSPSVTKATPSKTTKTYGPTSKTACPDQTTEAARARGGTDPFKVRLYVKSNRSEVWICMDANHTLFYQGHILDKPFTGATTDNALFLTTVEPSDHHYEAKNNDYTYYVSPTAIVIEDPHGNRETQEAVDYFQQ